jgi:hypothetical protein
MSFSGNFAGKLLFIAAPVKLFFTLLAALVTHFARGASFQLQFA